ncbi:hypothetical protein TB2_046937 [Malus domestica]
MSPSTSSPPPAYSIVLRHHRIKRLHEFQVRGGNADQGTAAADQCWGCCPHWGERRVEGRGNCGVVD